MDILLIRSGMTDYESQGRVQGQLDLPLNPEGRKQVAEMVDQLTSEIGDRSIAFTYASPEEASAKTAETVSKAFGSKLRRMESLRNMDLGLWQGKLIDEIKSQQPKTYRLWQEQPGSVCAPEGELVADARSRIAEFLSKLPGKKGHGSRDGKEPLIAIVVPEPLATLVAWEVTKQLPAGMHWKSALEGRRWELIKLLPEPLVTR